MSLVSRSTKVFAVTMLGVAVSHYALSTNVYADLFPITDFPFYGSFPLSCGWHISCHNGAVPHGIPPVTDNHGFDASQGGVDIAAPVGTSLFAPGHGTVTFGGSQGLFGTVVDINHGSGNRSAGCPIGKGLIAWAA